MLLSGRISIGEMPFFPTRQLSLVAINGPHRVYRIDGHRDDELFVARLRRLGRLSVAYWGWMSYNWAGTLERIYGRFTVNTHEQILTNVMIPSA